MIKMLSLFSIDLMKEIEIVNGKAKDYDVVIATGSNNTNRYFEYYFGKPHIYLEKIEHQSLLSTNKPQKMI